MSFEYEDLLNYGGVRASSEIGEIEIPEVHEGDYTDLSYSAVIPEEAKDISFEDIRQFNKKNSDAFTRLDRYVFDREEGIFYIDRHNHALAGWLAAHNQNVFDDSTALLHVDAHPDYEEPEPFFPPENTSQPEKLIGGMTQVNEFIYPAEQWGIIDSKTEWGTENTDLNHLQESGAGSMILDIDLDVFEKVKESEPIYRRLNRLITESGFTTIATSPGYIDQNEAINHIEEIMKSE